jgi:hypothetical protein
MAELVKQPTTKEQIAKLLKLSADGYRLQYGEMSMDTVRSIKAVLNSLMDKARAEADELADRRTAMKIIQVWAGFDLHRKSLVEATKTLDDIEKYCKELGVKHAETSR